VENSTFKGRGGAFNLEEIMKWRNPSICFQKYRDNGRILWNQQKLRVFWKDEKQAAQEWKTGVMKRTHGMTRAKSTGLHQCRFKSNSQPLTNWFKIFTLEIFI